MREVRKFRADQAAFPRQNYISAPKLYFRGNIVTHPSQSNGLYSPSMERRPPLNHQNTPPYRPNAPSDDVPPPPPPPRLLSIHRDNVRFSIPHQPMIQKSRVTPIHPPTSLAVPIVPPIPIAVPPPSSSSFVVPKVSLFSKFLCRNRSRLYQKFRKTHVKLELLFIMIVRNLQKIRYSQTPLLHTPQGTDPHRML